MKVKIRLDTGADAIKFSNIASALEGNINVVDNKGLRVSAKSILGMLYAMEFEELWCESETRQPQLSQALPAGLPCVVVSGEACLKGVVFTITVQS